MKVLSGNIIDIIKKEIFPGKVYFENGKIIKITRETVK